MITQFGMSEKFGMMGLATCGEPVSGWQSSVKLRRSRRHAEIDQEVMQILIKHCYEEAKRLLKENREVLDKIAEFLY